MSSTQRSEGINAYFDGYISSTTTLKQFVEQYENALANKVESEKLDDMRSWSSYIPCIDDDDKLEKQFQSVYTHAKVKEFQTELTGKMRCHSYKKEGGHILSEYEVKQWVTFGEGDERMKKQVSFTVHVHAETNESHCNCGLFESKGMLCRHQLIVYDERGIDKVPDKYVLRRWCKNIKMAHTKVRIKYDNSEPTIEAQRHDNICKLFSGVADLAEDCPKKYEMVMKRGQELKQELIDASVVCESNMAHDGKTKEVEEIAVDHVFGTQESVANVYSSYMGPPMWPNMMSHNMSPNMIQGGTIFPYSPSFFQSQGQGWGGQQSFTDMMNAEDNGEE